MNTRVVIGGLMLILSLGGLASGQNVNLLSAAEADSVAVVTLSDTSGAEEQIDVAIPAGATAGRTTSGGADNAGALLGLQFWQEEKYFLSGFFNYSGTNQVTGEPRNFGQFLLNPNTTGQSFYFAGNVKVTNNPFWMGIGLNAGLVFTEWIATINDEEQSNEGFVIYLAPSLLIQSKSFEINEETKFSMGCALGPSIRMLGGDLALEDDFRASAEVLGFSNKTLVGFEFQFFFKINTIQPFVKLTYFKTDETLKGFSDLQAYMGVNVLSSIIKSKI